MDERSLLKELTRRVPEEDPAAREQARARLHELIQAEARSRSEITPQAPRRGRTDRSPWAAAALVACVVGAILVIQVVVGPTRVAGALDLGQTALGHPVSEIEPGSYVYTRSVGTALTSLEILAGGGSYMYRLRVRREIWLASDGSGFLVERYSHPRFTTPADRAAWRRADSPDLTPDPLRQEFQPGDFPTRPFEENRTDPLALVQSIRDHADRFREGELEGDLGLIAEFLGESPASAELRAAILELLATMDLAWDGNAVDPRGRAGVSLSTEAGGIRTTLVFDPADSQLMSYSTERIGEPSQVVTSYAFVRRGVVGAIGARPEGSGT